MVKILEIIQKPPGPILLSLLVVIIFYCLAVSARNGSGNGERWSPVALTAGVSGRGSLANLQVFFFTLVVVWLAVFWLIKDHSLIDLSGDVLILLGISAAGTGGAKITAAARKKLSLGNMSWLRKKGWIKENLDKTSGPPVPA